MSESVECLHAPLWGSACRTASAYRLLHCAQCSTNNVVDQQVTSPWAACTGYWIQMPKWLHTCFVMPAIMARLTKLASSLQIALQTRTSLRNHPCVYNSLVLNCPTPYSRPVPSTVPMPLTCHARLAGCRSTSRASAISRLTAPCCSYCSHCVSPLSSAQYRQVPRTRVGCRRAVSETCLRVYSRYDQGSSTSRRSYRAPVSRNIPSAVQSVSFNQQVQSTGFVLICCC